MILPVGRRIEKRIWKRCFHSSNHRNSNCSNLPHTYSLPCSSVDLALNKATNKMALLTVKRFDFSELSVSESGTVTSICLDIAFATNGGYRTARNFEDFVTDDQGIRRSRTSRTKIKRNPIDLGNTARDPRRNTLTELTKKSIATDERRMEQHRLRQKRNCILGIYLQMQYFNKIELLCETQGSWVKPGVTPCSKCLGRILFLVSVKQAAVWVKKKKHLFFHKKCLNFAFHDTETKQIFFCQTVNILFYEC